LAQTKCLSLAYEGPQQCLVKLDETLFHRVLLNLIDTAIKHSPNGATVYARLTLTGAYNSSSSANDDNTGKITLEVIDIGPGFSPKDLPYIFDRFYRADPSRTRSGSETEHVPTGAGERLSGSRGSGLGLAIVSQIVEAHSGTITAANHPDLGGAWLRLYLPTAALVEPAQRAVIIPDSR
ncbi:MAG: ATP-binding protein, partial [Cyanobacteria bacterium J06638_6]